MICTNLRIVKHAIPHPDESALMKAAFDLFDQPYPHGKLLALCLTPSKDYPDSLEIIRHYKLNTEICKKECDECDCEE